jgi:signal peptidase I
MTPSAFTSVSPAPEASLLQAADPHVLPISQWNGREIPDEDTGSAPMPSPSIAVANSVVVPDHGLLQSAQSLLYIVVVALFIVTFCAQPFRIPSESMEPTLQVGDFLLVDKQVTPDLRQSLVGSTQPVRAFGKWLFAPNNVIHRGDLIVFHYPVDPTLHLVKRVIGLPGDRIHLRDDRVYINDRAINEPYAVYSPSAEDSYRDDFPHLQTADSGVDAPWWIRMHTLVAHGELSVPADSYFVLGDNRNNSDDSRYWGLVPRESIVGKPFLIYFSLNRAGTGAQAANASTSFATSPSGRKEEANGFVRWERILRIIR